MMVYHCLDVNCELSLQMFACAYGRRLRPPSYLGPRAPPQGHSEDLYGFWGPLWVLGTIAHRRPADKHNRRIQCAGLLLAAQELDSDATHLQSRRNGTSIRQD